MAMQGPPEVGQLAVYNPLHGNGYGQNAKGQELTAEMTELDLNPGTSVEVHAIGADPPHWPIVHWIDGVGINRLTSIEQGQWNSDFDPAT